MPILQRLHEPDAIAADLRAALDLVEQLAPPEDLRQLTFQYAVQLTTARAMSQPGAVDLSQLQHR